MTVTQLEGMLDALCGEPQEAPVVLSETEYAGLLVLCGNAAGETCHSVTTLAGHPVRVILELPKPILNLNEKGDEL